MRPTPGEKAGSFHGGENSRAESLESMASLPAPMIYVSRAAVITGDVAIGKDSSVWHCAVLRGDLDRIRVGECVSIQDNAVVHVDLGNPVEIVGLVTVGHGAVVHGCEIGEDCIIGMGSVVGSRAKIGRGTLIGACAVVPEGKEIPRDSVVVGVPAKVVRRTQDFHQIRIEASWRGDTELARKNLPPGEGMKGEPKKRGENLGGAGVFKKKKGRGGGGGGRGAHG